MHKLLLLLGLGAFLVAPSAFATLIAKEGGTLIYDTERNITWLADANYAQTSGYDDDGRMTYLQAEQFVSSLNYNGYTGWRLPKSSMVDATCSNTRRLYDTQYDFGVNCRGSEMGDLYYNELGGEAWSSIMESTDPDLALFSNIQSGHYWSNLLPVGTSSAEAFHFHYDANGGFQRYHDINSTFYVFAVQSGDIASVPEPGTLMLMGMGLLGLGAMARKKQA